MIHFPILLSFWMLEEYLGDDGVLCEWKFPWCSCTADCIFHELVSSCRLSSCISSGRLMCELYLNVYLWCWRRVIGESREMIHWYLKILSLTSWISRSWESSPVSVLKRLVLIHFVNPIEYLVWSWVEVFSWWLALRMYLFHLWMQCWLGTASVSVMKLPDIFVLLLR